MGVMAWGMWRARYWAVLGFQTVLVFLMIAFTLQLVAAGSWFQVDRKRRPAGGRGDDVRLHGQGAGANPDAGPQASPSGSR